MKSLIYLLVAYTFIGCAGPIYESNKEYDLVGVKSSKWTIRVPHNSMKLERISGDDKKAYILWSNGLTTLSIFIEPATKCSSSSDCRDRAVMGFASMKHISDPQLWDDENASFSQYLVKGLEGMTINQLHVNKHFVRDNYWFDMHISQMFSNDKSKESLMSILNGIDIVERVKK